MFKKTVLAAAVAILASAAGAQAAPIFSDNFDSETLGLNYTGFAKWDVTAGSVDLIGGNPTNFFNFYPGQGNYVDLDGTTGSQNPAGQISTKDIFAAGDYTLTFLLGGSTRGDTNTVTVALNGFSQNITLASDAGLTSQSFTFHTDGGKLSFTNLGASDNVGLILDNVSLSTATAVPEPLTLSLFGTGLAGAAVLRRRKKANKA